MLVISRKLLRFSSPAFRFSHHHQQLSKNQIKIAEQPQFHNFYLGKPPTRPNRWSLSYLCKYPPFNTKAFINLVSRSAEETQTQIISDNFNPPKIHQNSVFVYQSIHISKWLKTTRSFQPLLILGYICVVQYPVFTALSAFLHYAIWGRTYIYTLSKRLVIRMDILPHIESLSLQTVGLFGRINTSIVPINEIEYCQQLPDQQIFFKVHKSSVNKNLKFKNKITGEYYLFDRQGLWDQEGLKHPLIY